MAGPRFGLAVLGQHGVVPLVRRDFLKTFVFYNGDELQISGIQFKPEKAINIQWLAGVEAVDAGQRVERHAVPLEQLGRRKHLVKRGLATFGDAIWHKLSPVAVREAPKLFN